MEEEVGERASMGRLLRLLGAGVVMALVVLVFRQTQMTLAVVVMVVRPTLWISQGWMWKVGWWVGDVRLRPSRTHNLRSASSVCRSFVVRSVVVVRS